jgi:hypothetical protein
MEVSGHFYVPAAVHPGKEPPVPIGEETGWTPEPVWTLDENKCLNYLKQSGVRNVNN